MNIGIDIDDTIVDTTKIIVKYADIYNKEILGKEEISKKVGMIKDRFYLNSIYGFDDNTKKDFFSIYYKNILEECTLKESVVEVLKALKNEGNNIYFISARIPDVKNCDTYNITKNMLDKNDIPYDELIIGSYDKIDNANKYNIDVFVDDCYDICVNLHKNNIKSILMTSEINFEINTGNIARVDNWFEAYLKINEYKNKLNK